MRRALVGMGVVVAALAVATVPAAAQQPAPPPPPAPQAPDRVTAIEFIGLSRSNPVELRKAMATKVGAIFDAAMFARDAQLLDTRGVHVMRTQRSAGRLVLVVEERVTALEFTGLKWARPSDLQSLMRTRPGQAYARTVLDEDIRTLGLRGFFVERIDHRRGRLILTIDEKPRIRSIGVTGTKEVAEADVRTAAGLTTKDALIDEVLLERAREAVRALYRQRGYHFASVILTTKPAIRGVRVDIRIDEGPKTHVEAVEITGAHGIAPDTLRDLMKTKATGWVQNSYLEPADLESDVAMLQRTYRERGWLDAVVTERPITYSADGAGLTIHLHVEEGRRYRVRDVRVEGAEAIPDTELIDLLQMRLDEPLDGRAIFGDGKGSTGDLQRLKNHYEDQGYFYAQITPQPRILDPAKAEIEIVYTIHEGQPTRIGRVDIYGNRITREKVVRRMLPFYPGEKVRTERLQLGFLQLMQSQYFSNVNIRPRQSQTVGYTDIVVEVEESVRNGTLQFGGAFNQSLGFQGQFSMKIANFDIAQWSWPWNIFRPPHWRGGGQTLDFSLSAGRRATNYTLSWNEPRFLDSLFSLSVSGEITSFSQIDYDVRRQGGTIGVGRNIFRWLGVGVSWTGQFVQMRNVGAFAPPELLALEQLGRRPLTKWRARATFDWVDRDIGRRPYRGFQLQLATELAHKSFGSHWNFWSLSVKPEFHWTLFGEASGWRHVITFKTGFDYAEPLEGDATVPFFERYFAGGFGTIRGFDFRDVGPRVNNRPIGGRILATGSLEYSFPLYRDTPAGPHHIDIIRMVFFYDMATVLRDWEDYSTEQWRSSFGFGFRLNPIGFPVPFALDFGWALKREDTDDRELISVTFDVRF